MKINRQLAEKTHEILMENKQERHIRGGIATREKYLKEHQAAEKASGFAG